MIYWAKANAGKLFTSSIYSGGKPGRLIGYVIYDGRVLLENEYGGSIGPSNKHCIYLVNDPKYSDVYAISSLTPVIDFKEEAKLKTAEIVRLEKDLAALNQQLVTMSQEATPIKAAIEKIEARIEEIELSGREKYRSWEE